MTTPVLRMVAAQVEARPDGEAVVGIDGVPITYRELWDRAGRIAAHLHELGAGPGHAVGLHTERSTDLVVGIVGIMRSGAVCVPLDVSYPAERLRFMCEDSGVRLILGHGVPLDGLGGTTPTRTHGDLVLAHRNHDGPFPDLGPDLAYLVYTSGSTGRPKGVRYDHRNLANLIVWQIEQSVCGAGDRTLQFAPASFDVTFQEIYSTLGAGGTVVCCTEDDRLDPQLLLDRIESQRVNRLFTPFVTIQSLALFAALADPARHPLREILTSGEQVQCNARVRDLFTRLDGCHLVNQWGTTETHVSTWHVLSGDPAAWPDLPPVGVAIRNSVVTVLGEDGTELPTGEAGELWIAGDCVGPGYLNLPERSARSYVPYPPDPSLPAYRTGDLGRRRPDGLLEFLGRGDTQVKVRGFRIELGEIETLLGNLPTVAEAVVTVGGDTAESRYLRAHVVPAGTGFDPDETRRILAERLPPYMIPSRFVTASTFPRTPSGKIDRRGLAEA
ncbi:amino acid adenylation domain-containing protein [Actinoplanes sp. G11-F43]|uniref:amino acid adenylation domain-containing protein n=1 Tax=Actinoplanes sp. G11-F43 TaxID=3424130 RepID=UPI003D34F336